MLSEKKKQFLISLVFVVLLIVCNLVRFVGETATIEIKYYDKNTVGAAQVFWATEEHDFSSSYCFARAISNGSANLLLDMDAKEAISYRLDFLNEESEYGIEKISLMSGPEVYMTISGEQLAEYCQGYYNVKEHYIKDGVLFIIPANNDSSVVLNPELTNIINDGFKSTYSKYNVALSVFLLLAFTAYARRKKELSNDVVYAIGAWIIMIILVFGEFILGQRVLTYTNIMYSNYPWLMLGENSYGPALSDPADSFLPGIYEMYYSHNEGVSLWSSNVAFGSPIESTNLLNCVNWIIYALPIGLAILIKAIMELSLAYFGMYFLCKRQGLFTGASVFSGISYACSSAMIMWQFWPHTDIMALAPWSLLLGIKLIEDRKIVDGLMLAVVIYFMMIVGMPPFAGYVLYLLGFMVLFCTIFKYRNEIKIVIRTYVIFGASAVLGLIMSVPYLIDLFGQVVENGYADGRKYQARNVLELKYLSTIMDPYERVGLDKHMNESTVFFGIVGIILVIVCFVNIKRIKRRYWMVSGITLAVLVFTHILDDVYVLLPAINTSDKARLINLLVLVVCVLAGQGLDCIYMYRDELRKLKCLLIRMVVYIGVVFVLVDKGFFNPEYCTEFAMVLFTIIAVELIALLNNVRARKILFLMLLVVNMMNVTLFANGYLPSIDKQSKVIPDATDSIAFLQDSTETERVYVLGRFNLFPNTNAFYDINSISSHSFVNTNPDMSTYLREIDDQMSITATAYHGTKIDNYNLLKWAGVKYVVKRASNEVDTSKMILTYSGNDGLEVYELDQYNEKYFLSEDVLIYSDEESILNHMKTEYNSNTVCITEELGYKVNGSKLKENETIKVISDQTDYVDIEVSISEDRFVVLNEYYYDNWDVYIDGQKCKLEKVNYLFKGVLVPEGNHRVEFKYNTNKIVVPMIISMVLLIVIMISIVILKLNEKKKVGDEITDEINNPNTMLQ